MMKSLLIKAGMLAVTAAMVIWIGWPIQEPAFIDTSTDTPPERPVPAQIVAPAVSSVTSDHPIVSEPRQSRPSEAKRIASSKLDLNRATVDELRTLPGIGEALAQRMIERRTMHGPYRTIDDLRDVKGIGAKRLEKLRPLVGVGATSAPKPHSKSAL
jgi:competence protein ComEA